MRVGIRNYLALNKAVVEVAERDIESLDVVGLGAGGCFWEGDGGGVAVAATATPPIKKEMGVGDCKILRVLRHRRDLDALLPGINSEVCCCSSWFS